VGKRSRKARTGAGGRPDGSAPSADGGARGYARSRARNDAVRAELEPLAPGERPLAVTIAAVVALAIAVANLVLYLAGFDVRGEDPTAGGAFVVCAVFAAAAAGMWRVKYWAVIGFEVLLGVLLVSASLSLMLASNVRGALLSVAVIAASGPLFWFLIRAMARIQMPGR
jgi:hypothetical protein